MKVAVLGSSGAMGAFFVRYFVEHGHTVVGSDPKQARRVVGGFERAGSNPQAVKDADLVLIAVPAKDTVEVVREVLPSMKEGSTIVEVTSLKSERLVELKEAVAGWKVALLSVHPLFGPSSRSNRPKICVIGGLNDVKAAKRLFPRGLLIRMGEREHDRMMAYTLSLVHLLNLSFVSAVAEGAGIKQFEKVSTPLGTTQMRLSRAVLSQDPSLFSYIQTGNPFVAEMLSSLIGELEGLKQAVEKRDAARLERLFVRASERFWKADLEDALRRVYLDSGS